MHFVLSLLLLFQEDPQNDLQHINPEVRKHACALLGQKGIQRGVRPLIDLLGRESDDSVRSAAVEALERLTGVKGYGPDFKKWDEYWTTVGNKRFPLTNLTKEEVEKLVQPKIAEVEKKAENFKAEIRILTIVVAIIATAFVLVMIYFVGHVSSKLKEWKELVRQAGVYIEESQQITKRTDRVLEELEAKKTDIHEFIKKVKDEKETEIERYADLLQQNTEHKMREEMMALRQKAEKELEETLGQLRQQIEIEMRRMGGDQKEKTDKDFKAQHDRFMREVEAHTIFLQANFLQTHGKPEEALKFYRKLVAVKPDHEVAWVNMGNAYREQTRYDEALESYQKAIELDPNDPSALYNMAATFALMRKREKMLETLTLAIKNDGEFKDEALNEPAFRDYWNDPAFKDLAES
ncbi:MAG TPA: tetratricopeptide repeat protein [Planctomycetota bacterium]|nr:tetratricopeptide repeat protein [Planctomycetota bacterium]